MSTAILAHLAHTVAHQGWDITIFNHSFNKVHGYYEIFPTMDTVNRLTGETLEAYDVIKVTVEEAKESLNFFHQHVPLS